MRHLIKMKYCLLFLWLSYSSCLPPHKAGYRIDSEMESSKWSGENGMRRKINYGDIIHVEIFAAQRHSTGKFPPIVTHIRIPVRKIDSNSWLKDYEKNFLLAVLGTNAYQTFNLCTIPPPHNMRTYDSLTKWRHQLIDFWNFCMENSYITYSDEAFRKTDIVINWNELPEGGFKEYLLEAENDSTRRRIVRMPRKNYSLYEYFIKTFAQDSDSKYYKSDNTGDVGFTFISFSLEVNGLAFENSKTNYEESTWSMYDWLHCGVFLLEGMNETTGKTKVRTIGFDGIDGMFRIKDNASHSIKYLPGIVNMGDCIIGNKSDDQHQKSLTELDLLNVSPKMVRKITFKDSL